MIEITNEITNRQFSAQIVSSMLGACKTANRSEKRVLLSARSLTGSSRGLWQLDAMMERFFADMRHLLEEFAKLEAVVKPESSTGESYLPLIRRHPYLGYVDTTVACRCMTGCVVPW